MTVSISSLLSATLTANTKSQTQLTLNAISNTLTDRLNKQIAQVQTQASDTTTAELLQRQLDAANTQNTAITLASSQWLKNEKSLSDLSVQLTALSTAAAGGDAVGFDKSLAAAQLDVTNLTVVGFVPGTQPDGVVNLKLNGLGIQSSATYNLSTPAGQAQAATDITKAQTLINQITSITTQNQVITTSQSNALTAQIDDLTRRLGEISDNQTTTAQTQIAKLQKQEQFQFHVIELALQNSTSANSVLVSGASSLAGVLASQPGSRTAPKGNQFIGVLQSNTGIANRLNATRLGLAAKQPDGTTVQNEGISQAAAGSLLNLFS